LAAQQVSPAGRAAVPATRVLQHFQHFQCLMISALKSKLFSAEDRQPKNVVFG
jgi:hypothetical protein